MSALELLFLPLDFSMRGTSPLSLKCLWRARSLVALILQTKYIKQKLAKIQVILSGRLFNLKEKISRNHNKNNVHYNSLNNNKKNTSNNTPKYSQKCIFADGMTTEDIIRATFLSLFLGFASTALCCSSTVQARTDHSQNQHVFLICIRNRRITSNSKSMIL